MSGGSRRRFLRAVGAGLVAAAVGPVLTSAEAQAYELSPHELVAVLHLPAQNPYTDARRRYADDVLSFNPQWNRAPRTSQHRRAPRLTRVYS